MKKTTKLLMSFLVAMTVFGLMPNMVPAEAQTGTGPGGCTTDCPDRALGAISEAFPGNWRNMNVATLAKTIINWALYLAAIVAVIMIIYGGFLYITSAGNDV